MNGPTKNQENQEMFRRVSATEKLEQFVSEEPTKYMDDRTVMALCALSIVEALRIRK